MVVKQEKNNDGLVYPDLSYKVVGCLFEVFNNLGYGHKEKFYQKAFAQTLVDRDLQFGREESVRIKYKGEDLGMYYLDFLIEGKIVVEIKVRNYFSKKDIEQLYRYLRAAGLKLGIIAHFTKKGVKFKRVVNVD